MKPSGGLTLSLASYGSRYILSDVRTGRSNHYYSTLHGVGTGSSVRLHGALQLRHRSAHRGLGTDRSHRWDSCPAAVNIVHDDSSLPTLRKAAS